MAVPCLPMLIVAVCALFAAVSGAAAPVHLYGSGGTTVQQFMKILLPAINIRNNALIIYRPIGSGEGRNEFINQTSQFAESDVPLSEAEEAKLKSQGGLGVHMHIPFAIQTITVFTFIPGASFLNLRFTPSLLAKIFQGQVTRWSDPLITVLNPGLPVAPSQKIYTIVRRDVSGTTQLFTQWLKLSVPNEFKLNVGGKVNWPNTVLYGIGSEGVASAMRATPYSIGYIGSSIGNFLGLQEARLLNPSKVFLSTELADNFAAVPATLPASTAHWSDVSLLNAPGLRTWPITSFVYILVRQNAVPYGPRGPLLKGFLNYLMTSPAQQLAAGVNFYILPSRVVSQNLAAIRSIVLAKGSKELKLV